MKPRLIHIEKYEDIPQELKEKMADTLRRLLSKMDNLSVSAIIDPKTQTEKDAALRMFALGPFKTLMYMLEVMEEETQNELKKLGIDVSKPIPIPSEAYDA